MTEYVIIASEGSEGDEELVASGYKTRRAAEKDKWRFDGPPTRRVVTLRTWKSVDASQQEVSEDRLRIAARDNGNRRKTNLRLAGLVCPVNAAIADYTMLVGPTQTVGRTQTSVPVADCGLRALLGGRKSLRVDYAGRLDFDSHLLEDAQVEWYVDGVRHLVVIPGAYQRAGQ